MYEHLTEHPPPDPQPLIPASQPLTPDPSFLMLDEVEHSCYSSHKGSIARR
jgi:hypothetical protein